MTSKKKFIVCIVVIIALAIAGPVGSAALTKFATPAQQTETKQQKKKNKNSTNAKTEKELKDSKNDSSYQDGAGHVFLRVDKLSNLSSGDKKKLYSAVADFTSENNYDMPDGQRTMIEICKKPVDAPQGKLVYLHLKNSEIYFGAQKETDDWTVFPLTEQVEGVNDSTTGSTSSYTYNENMPENSIKITDTEEIAAHIGDAAAQNLYGKWSDQLKSIDGSIDPSSSVIPSDSFNQGQTGSIFFQIYVTELNQSFACSSDSDGNINFY